MVPIPGIERARALLGNFSYTSFSMVHVLEFRQDGSRPRPTYSVYLILESFLLPVNYRLHLRFRGDQQLTISHFGGSPTQVTGFAIVDIRDHQLEDVAYEIIDYEGEKIRWLCSSAEIEKAERL